MADGAGGQLIETRVEGGIVVVQLDRPPANALTADFLDEIDAAARRLAGDASVRAVVLRGYEKVFSGGMDLKALPSFDEAEQRAVVDGLNSCYGTLYAFPKPLVAVATGHAIAGGLFFILAADYRIGGEGRALFGLAEVRVGVSFPLAPLEIARAELTAPMARRLLLTGQPVTMSEALAGGIVDEVVAPDQAEARAIEKAREMARSPAEAYAAIKRQIRGAVIDRIEHAVANLDDPLRAHWFTDETVPAAKRVLAGEG
jgi:enoyl-CoA hydratase/carnithine racemase